MQYLDTTSYDRAVNWFLDQPFIAFIVLICVIIMAIPQLRDGIKILFQKKKKQDFTIKYADETISFEEKCISRDFDIIKIKATTHDIGVAAEREWLKKKYPRYVNNMQMLSYVQTEKGRIIFDILPIKVGEIKKDIYFDITDFYKGAGVPTFKAATEYAEQTIQSLYK